VIPNDFSNTCAVRSPTIFVNRVEREAMVEVSKTN
jgi:hypothetical protein